MLGPGRQRGKDRCHLAALETILGAIALQALRAAVVAAPFQQRDLLVANDRPANQGNVFLEQLVLQVAGAGRYHHPGVTQKSWHQVSEGLADTGAGLDHARFAEPDRLVDQRGHAELAVPRFEIVDIVADNAVRTEHRRHIQFACQCSHRYPCWHFSLSCWLACSKSSALLL
jgi:hypothetical protein